eukprot:gb/GFBE01076943.1/.p1 GENE.gb/GFBE01076943.1/~~gb/GFBE01076943.1/.p1  ORF type:complete len:311 (+),score=43.62 gb/GFBE01076943.1/:1-933(+)
MAGKWACIFGREAVALEVSSHLCLAELSVLLAACPAVATVFREAGAPTGVEHEEDDDLCGLPTMVDLVCSALGALICSGHMRDLEGLVRPPKEGGKPILSLAAASGRPDVVRWLLKNSQYVTREGNDELSGACPLHFAALGGHGHVCEVLLREGGTAVDTRDNLGLRPLHLAAEQGHVDACRALLEAKCQPDGPTGVNDITCGVATPLLLAAECGHAEVCGLLITFRADPLAPSLDGRTPLAVARESGGGSGFELLASLEAALWPDATARRQKGQDACGSVEVRPAPVLKGPQAEDIIRRTMRQRFGSDP